MRLEEKTISNFEYIYFETQNLLVRQYMMNDIDELYEIMSNPQVRQYTKDKNHPWDRFKTEQYIQFFMNKNFVTLDCFHGAIIDKASSKIIGIAGLNPFKKTNLSLN